LPVVSRSRTIAAIPEHVWDVVADPHRLMAWWPNVQRVEDVDPKAWTTVLTSPKGGRAVRADYTLISSDYARKRSWRHEVAASPFERVLSASETDVILEPAGERETEVTLVERLTLRGVSRLGGLQMGRASKRKLDDALDGLEQLFATQETAN
jgi:uncharacterized protein YndB with AHSA1/START domain